MFVAAVLTVRNPARPRVLATFMPRGLVHAIELTSTHAILGYETRGQGFATGGGIDVVDLRTPAETRTVAALDLGESVMELAVHGDRLIAMSSDGALTVVNLREPNHPMILGRFAAETKRAAGMAGLPSIVLSTDGRHAYVARAAVKAGSIGIGQGMMKVVDLKDPAAPRLEGELESRRPVIRLCRSGFPEVGSSCFAAPAAASLSWRRAIRHGPW